MKALAPGAALGLALLSMVLLAPHAPVSAAETDVEGDVLNAERVCATGVTPEVTQAYERLRAPLVREARVTDLVVPFELGGALVRRRQDIRTADATAHGTTTNFRGLRSPELIHVECVQTP